MRLKEYYKKEVLPELKKRLNIKNDLAAPRLAKAVLNVGFGRNTKDKELIKFIEDNLTIIAGQKPVLTKAKKAVSAFKIKEGMIIGATVTLRGQRMYDFVERLINVYLPRVRDFRGISEKSVDRTGCLTIGFKDILAFAEIEVRDLEKLHGVEICLATTAGNREGGLELFRLLKFPLRKE
ncbi:MAG TPA: 50S ribosomal protein L5, partial [Candidatus Methylomirabilis sp.]|nr:50S ribosomal protein L5 [Candidatus Methylomirabilis sp.]